MAGTIAAPEAFFQQESQPVKPSQHEDRNQQQWIRAPALRDDLVPQAFVVGPCGQQQCMLRQEKTNVQAHGRFYTQNGADRIP